MRSSPLPPPSVEDRDHPLLNGMLHLNALDGKFGPERVLGGLCAIALTLNEAREVVQTGADAVAQFRRTRRYDVGAGSGDSKIFNSGISARWASQHIMQDMWRSGCSWLRSQPHLPDAHLGGNILAVAGGRTSCSHAR